LNPELLRNLWLEATPLRLALIAGLLLLVFAATGVAPTGLATTSTVALALYWFFAVLWGTRSAALSVVGEIRERTWDSQKLSSIGPWDMVWGKLLGATSANWFGALLCLPGILLPAWRDEGAVVALTYGIILLGLGLFGQAVALLSSLMLVRRQTGNWRLDTFLCQVAGIGAAFAFYGTWNSVAAFVRAGEQTLVWWGIAFSANSFHLASLLLFLGWALVGCWRAMRAELRFANGPYVWLIYLAFIAIYYAGFESVLAARAPALHLAGTEVAWQASTIRLTLAGMALLMSAYSMVFLEPKDPVRMRWLGEQVRAGNFYRAFLSLDAWMLSYGATLVVGLVLAVTAAVTGASGLILSVLAVLGFLTRDVAIFVLMRGRAGAKGDFAALAIIGALYLLVPMILNGVGAPALAACFLPATGSPVVPIVAWAQGVGVAIWAARTIAVKFTAR
jgi:hypothetical protein